MYVYVNDIKLRIFEGARVIDVVRMYSKESLREIQNGEKIVTDDFGNEVDLGGSLSSDQVLKICIKPLSP